MLYMSPIHRRKIAIIAVYVNLCPKHFSSWTNLWCKVLVRDVLISGSDAVLQGPFNDDLIFSFDDLLVINFFAKT